jgi:hypothetical protein
VKRRAAASLEAIGDRVLRSSRRLFARPALDETRAIYRDLTTIPVVRLSRVLEPLCGTAENAPLRQLEDEDVPPTVAAAATPAMPASPRPVLPQIANSGAAAKVFTAMNALNLNPQAARSTRVSDAPQQQRSRAKSVQRDDASETFTRTPVRVADPPEHEDRRIQEPVRARMRKSARPLPHPLATMPAATSTKTNAVGPARTAPAGLRMAQGAPRIAALLQAHVAGTNKSDDKTSQTVQPLPNPYPIGFEANAGDPRLAQNAGNAAAVDMDLLMERLSQQLEFELMRIYGTSEG